MLSVATNTVYSLLLNHHRAHRFLLETTVQLARRLDLVLIAARRTQSAPPRHIDVFWGAGFLAVLSNAWSPRRASTPALGASLRVLALVGV